MGERSLIEVSADKLKAALESERIDRDALSRILARLTDPPSPARLHSTMTPHEAQDWLAANDPEGANYWRTAPLSSDLIATVGEHLQAAGNTERWLFDADWQARYARGEVD